MAEVVAAADPALAQFAADPPPEGKWAARLDGHRGFTLEAVYEGFLMHYREARAFTGMDPDLSLLAGDALYALGLERLAQAGDLAAVAELADLISACAQAQAEDRHEAVGALWEATATALAVPGPPAAGPPNPGA